MSGQRQAGAGRRFELVVIPLRPPSRETVGLVAKHASSRRYRWVLVMGSGAARPERVAPLLAVAYLDEARGVLGRGDPRTAVPRAFLRRSGEVELDEGCELSPRVNRELDRVSRELYRHHRPYLEDLCAALRGRPPGDRFRRVEDASGGWGEMFDPTGRALHAPHPPPLALPDPDRERPTRDDRGRPATPGRLESPHGSG